VVLHRFLLTDNGVSPEQAMLNARRLMVSKGKELAKFLENKFGEKHFNA